jgi:hypothetical protein
MFRVPRNNFWMGYFSFQIPWLVATLLFFFTLNALQLPINVNFVLIGVHVGLSIIAFILWIIYRRRMMAASPTVAFFVNTIGRFWGYGSDDGGQ